MEKQNAIQNPARFCKLALVLAIIIFATMGCFSLSSLTTHTQVPTDTLIPASTSMATLTLTPTTTATLTATSIPRWDEYESALVEAAYPGLESGICEWEILGQQKQEVYVWAICGDDTPNIMYMSAPAVVYLDADGSILRAQFPGRATYAEDIKVLFPPELQAKVGHRDISPDMMARFELRSEDPSIPPLIVVSGTPLP